MGYGSEEIDLGFSRRDRYKLSQEDRDREKIQVIGSYDEDNIDDFDRKVHCPNCRSRMDVHHEIKNDDPYWFCGECSTIVDTKIDKPLGTSGTEIVSLHDPFYERTPNDDGAPFFETIDFNSQEIDEAGEGEEVGVKPSDERIQHIRIKGTQVPSSLFRRDDREVVY